MHEIAGAKPGGEQRPGKAAKIGAPAFRLVDRARGNKDPAHRRNRYCGKPAEGRRLPLQLDQVGFAGQRQLRQSSPIGHLLRPQLRE